MANWLDKLERVPGRPPAFSLKIGNPALNDFFYNFWKTATQEGIEPLESEIACLEFFGRLLIHQADEPSSSPKPARDSQKFLLARTFVQDRFNDGFSLDELAAAVGTSPFYLIRLFRSRCGLTPFGYLRNYRLERAKKMMLKNPVLTEVAHACGFYDQSHFIRQFKNHMGMLPSEYHRAQG
jgi:AraC-like DNA-binding protein